MGEDDDNADIDVDSINLECHVNENNYYGDKNSMNYNFIPS